MTRSPTTRRRDPSDLFLGQPDGTFVQGAEAAGIVDYERGRGAALADLNLDGLPDLVEVDSAPRCSSGATPASATPAAGRAAGHWLGAAARRSRAPNRDAIGAWIEVATGDTTVAARADGRWRPRRRRARLGPLRARLGRRREVRVQWPDGTVGPWLPIAADQFAIIERGATAARAVAADRGQLTERTTRCARPGSRRSTCPTSAMPDRARSCRRRCYADAAGRAARAARTRRPTTGWSSTPTASTAPTSPT